MKPRFMALVAFLFFVLTGPSAAAAQNRFIVRTNGGLDSVLNLCSLIGCQVQGSLDGGLNQTFLVTTAGNFVFNFTNFTLGLVQSLLGIQSIEPDTLLSLPQIPLNNIISPG